LYPSLYKLAEEVYKKMGHHNNLFPRLPYNKNKPKKSTVLGKLLPRKELK